MSGNTRRQPNIYVIDTLYQAVYNSLPGKFDRFLLAVASQREKTLPAVFSDIIIGNDLLRKCLSKKLSNQISGAGTYE